MLIQTGEHRLLKNGLEVVITQGGAGKLSCVVASSGQSIGWIHTSQLLKIKLEKKKPIPLQLLENTTALARNTDPATSHEAATSLVELDQAGLEWAVVRALSSGDKNTDELQNTTELTNQSVTPRFAPLRKKGWIEAVGLRKGISGRKQTVWALTEAAKAYLKSAL